MAIDLDILSIAPHVRTALASGMPVVALESAVLTHGLPAPHHVEAIEQMQAAVRHGGAVPAVCLVVGGSLVVGASSEQIQVAAEDVSREKASVRDLGRVLHSGVTAGLTVSATLAAAQAVGITVFATGGIGGVHRGATETGDISSDLVQLARSPVLVVCSGAKSVLDIPRTLEYLETEGVPVVGFGTVEFPAFYLCRSGQRVPAVGHASDAAAVARNHWALGLTTGIVVGNPIPENEDIAVEEWNGWMELAQRDADASVVVGQDVTPFLLSRVAYYSAGRTVRANLSLLRHNASIAASIAFALAR